MSDANHIEEIAAAWLAREDGELTLDEMAELQTWLESDTLHRVGYLRLKATWQRADRLAALKQSVSPPLPQNSFRKALAIAACLLLAIAVGGGYYASLDQQKPEPVVETLFATKVGQVRNVELPDGSHMQLNTNTQVQANVTKSGRKVSLLKGEAYFDIVHDGKRTFVVYAGNRRITVLGTKFSVFRNGEDVQVIVQEGRVRVDVLNNPEISAPVMADRGNVVMARTDATLVLNKPQEEIENDLGWRHGLLIFRAETLAEVAEQFNRYSVSQIIIEGRPRDIRIGGSFKADNAEAFITLIQEGFGLNVRNTEGKIIISD